MASHMFNDDEWGLAAPLPKTADVRDSPFQMAGPNGTPGRADDGHWGFYDELVGEQPEAALPETYSGEDDEVLASRLQAALRSEPRPAPPRDPAAAARVAADTGHHPLRHAKEAGFPLCAAGCQHTVSAADDLVNTDRGLAHRDCLAARAPQPPSPIRPTAKAQPVVPTSAHDLARQHDARLKEGRVAEEGDPFAWLLRGGSGGSAAAAQGGDADLAAGASRYLAERRSQGGISVEALRDFTPAERTAIIEEGADGDVAGNFGDLDISGTHYEALEAAMGATSSIAPGGEDDSFIVGFG